ncbi:MAG: NfeD family protein [Kordiimonadaceae bacterium]|nr:NfeD family protein [Kordiimonadaceae bacterium]
MMEEYLTWMAANADWLWWSAGVLLLAGEMVIPGVYLLWIGLASLVTGVAAWLMPEMGFEGHGLIFAALAAVSVFIGNHFFYKNTADDGEAKVNTRGQKHVGKVYLAAEAFENGRGHVSVGDSRWLAQGPNAKVGEKMRVIAVNGTILMVEAVDD